ncbi:MAG: 3-oxoacyl-ACP reductase [Streptococcaceae bacterium]|jgi:3-oxoacyl-[acyl-carrier protein] reductase|nr:3-oxoacyl-ACP reductase [Streptococcaceae bacterium]
MIFTEFKGARVLVTGCASGIGLAQAKAFLNQGAIVYGLDKAPMPYELSCDFHFFQIDLRETKALEVVLEQIEVIDILLNTAGVLDDYRSLEMTDLADFRATLSVNLVSIFVTTKHFLPSMLRRKRGVIVNMCSIASLVAGGGGISYTTSKHALAGFTKQLALDYAARGIKVNAIAPGAIETPMNLKDFAGDGKLALEVAELTPLKRWGKASEVADLTLFLASKSSDYLQGVIVPLDGGWTLK